MKTKSTKLILLFTSLFLATAVSHAQSTNRLRFSVAGFSIASLEIAPGGKTPQQALIMCLPASDGFAPNVNVQIQPFADTIEAYVKVSLEQFTKAGLKLTEQKPLSKSAVLLEYGGEMQGKTLHFYARAEKSGDNVYLVTATATEEQWARTSTQLKACVDSFRCEAAK